MRTKQSTFVASLFVLALALSTCLVLAAPSRATFPGQDGLIAFSSWTAGGYQISVVGSDGTGLRQVTPGTDVCIEPSISPDGNTIVFVQSTAHGGEICAITTAGADVRVLASGVVDDPSFSPDGSRLVFVRDNQVWVMNADGSQQRKLTRFGGHTRASSPTYSPNGRTIAFVAEVCLGRRSAKNRCKIMAMNTNGSRLRRLAYTSAPYSTWNAALKSWTPPTSGVSFSPGGKRIVYGAERYANTGEVIRLMNADGSSQRVLAGSKGYGWPCYSPSGRQIVCLDSHSQISVVSRGGTHWRQLVHVSPFATEPYWGPLAR